MWNVEIRRKPGINQVQKTFNRLLCQNECTQCQTAEMFNVSQNAFTNIARKLRGSLASSCCRVKPVTRIERGIVRNGEPYDYAQAPKMWLVSYSIFHSILKNYRLSMSKIRLCHRLWAEVQLWAGRLAKDLGWMLEGNKPVFIDTTK